MATPRDLRYLAFLALFQLDARNGDDADAIRQSILLATEPLRDSAETRPRGPATAPSRGPRQPAPQALLSEIDWKADFVDALRGPISEHDVAKAWDMAERAWNARRDADQAVRTLAPTWPAHRQPAVDRALIRLAHWEMTAGGRPPRAVVNEAVEIAKSFSTDRSPSFINAVLDKVLKQVLARPVAPDLPEPEHDTPDTPIPDTPDTRTPDTPGPDTTDTQS